MSFNLICKLKYIMPQFVYEYLGVKHPIYGRDIDNARQNAVLESFYRIHASNPKMTIKVEGGRDYYQYDKIRGDYLLKEFVFKDNIGEANKDFATILKNSYNTVTPYFEPDDSDTEEDIRNFRNNRNIKSKGWLNFPSEKESSEFLDVRNPSDFPSEKESSGFLDIRNPSDFPSEKENESERSSSSFNYPEDKEKLGYKFFETDNDPFIYTSESSYDSSLDENIRKDMGLVDRQYSLYTALKYLGRGDYKKFLGDAYVRKIFEPAKALIESCGKGDKRNQTENLWRLAWAGKLKFDKNVFSIPKSECISCALKRDLNYVFYEETPKGFKKLGYMGPACYEIRFQALLELVQASKYAAYLLSQRDYQPGTKEFKKYIIKPIIKANDNILKAHEKMGKYKNPTKK